jgi:hypothetical protein
LLDFAVLKAAELFIILAIIMSDTQSAQTSTTTPSTTDKPAAPVEAADNPFAAPAHNPFAAFSSGGSSDSNNLFTFNPSSNSAASTSAAAANAEESDDKDEGDDTAVAGADSTAHYEPVVKLAEVETTTGEENDEELYKQ